MGEEPGSDWEATFTWAHDWLADSPPRNVWIGTTVEDQTRADERIPLLLSIPAKVRFLSCEPLLGLVDLRHVQHDRVVEIDSLTGDHGVYRPLQGRSEARIHWVICGGESGPEARPMHPDWALSLRNQCAAAGVPFLFKQWGEWLPAEVSAPVMPSEIRRITVRTPIKDPGPQRPEFHDWPDGAVSARVGKKAAGRLLDGREWNEFPAVEVRA